MKYEERMKIKEEQMAAEQKAKEDYKEYQRIQIINTLNYKIWERNMAHFHSKIRWDL